MEQPKISILIPTLNSEKVLGLCLESIKKQNFQKEEIEIIVADGGSSDRTREIAHKYSAIVIENPLKTAEAGKIAALKAASGEFIALIDSDNILPDESWLKEMIEPLETHPEVLGSEPWEYTWRKEDGFITRYCALIGMNDPLVMFLGNYDRKNLITGKWTEVTHEEKDLGNYLLLKFKNKDTKVLPTIGANGTVFRSDFLKKFTKKDYLFDIDILASEMKKAGSISFIKVKNGIIHTFCESSIKKFVRKQVRRAQDYMYFKKEKGMRDFNWNDMDFFGNSSLGLIKFVIFCMTIIPLVVQSTIGYSRKKDTAWFFHLLACEITFFVYAWFRIFGSFYRGEFSRKGWKQ